MRSQKNKSVAWAVIVAVLLLLAGYVTTYFSRLEQSRSSRAHFILDGVAFYNYEARYSSRPFANLWLSRLFLPLNLIDRKVRPGHWHFETRGGYRLEADPALADTVGTTKGGETSSDF